MKGRKPPPTRLSSQLRQHLFSWLGLVRFDGCIVTATLSDPAVAFARDVFTISMGGGMGPGTSPRWKGKQEG